MCLAVQTAGLHGHLTFGSSPVMPDVMLPSQLPMVVAHDQYKAASMESWSWQSFFDVNFEVERILQTSSQIRRRRCRLWQ